MKHESDPVGQWGRSQSWDDTYIFMSRTAHHHHSVARSSHPLLLACPRLPSITLSFRGKSAHTRIYINTQTQRDLHICTSNPWRASESRRGRMARGAIGLWELTLALSFGGGAMLITAWQGAHPEHALALPFYTPLFSFSFPPPSLSFSLFNFHAKMSLSTIR